MTEQIDVKTWLETYVNSDEWRTSLRKAVNDVENPAQKAKLLLDLLDYVMPKLKTVDPPTGNEGKDVSITYVQDTKEPRAKLPEGSDGG